MIGNVYNWLQIKLNNIDLVDIGRSYLTRHTVQKIRREPIKLGVWLTVEEFDQCRLGVGLRLLKDITDFQLVC